MQSAKSTNIVTSCQVRLLSHTAPNLASIPTARYCNRDLQLQLQQLRKVPPQAAQHGSNRSDSRTARDGTALTMMIGLSGLMNVAPLGCHDALWVTMTGRDRRGIGRVKVSNKGPHAKLATRGGRVYWDSTPL